MKINELAAQVGVTSKTIRYYEDIGLLPKPRRLKNNYRVYDLQDIERLKLVVGASRLGLSLNDIKEVLALRDRGQAPCQVLLNLLEKKADEIHQRIEELNLLEQDLRQLYELGLTFSENDIQSKHCVCHLVSLTN